MASELPLTPEHAREYDRLTKAGAPPGRDTFEKARANVAASAASKSDVAGGATKAASIDAAGGGPEDPVADVVAGAELAKSIKGSTSRPSVSLPSIGASSGRSASATITRIIWAIALGLIALEIASEATGQQWSFKLGAPWSGNPLQKQPYVPLFQGQDLNNSPMPINALPATPAPLSNRSAGNQAIN